MDKRRIIRLHLYSIALGALLLLAGWIANGGLRADHPTAQELAERAYICEGGYYPEGRPMWRDSDYCEGDTP